MVAEASLIAVAVIGTEGFHAAIMPIVLQQEGGVIDKRPLDSIEQCCADQHVVDALPAPLITIGTLGTVGAASIPGDIMQALLFKMLQDKLQIGNLQSLQVQLKIMFKKLEKQQIHNLWNSWKFHLLQKQKQILLVCRMQCGDLKKRMFMSEKR